MPYQPEKSGNRHIGATGFFAIFALLCFAQISAGQTAGDLVQRGTIARDSLQPEKAIALFRDAFSDSAVGVEALWKAAASATDLGEFESDKKVRSAYFSDAESWATQAVERDSMNADAQFTLARILGMSALSVGIGERVKYARRVRDHALAALVADSLHPGALHVLGRWHFEVMRLSGIERLLAKTFLGAGFFGEASWAEAEEYLLRAVAIEPDRLAHHLDLARVYVETDQRDKARSSYQRVLDGVSRHYNDDTYKLEARAELSRVKKQHP